MMSTKVTQTNQTTNKEEKKSGPKSSCDILKQMLANPPKKFKCDPWFLPRSGVILDCKEVTDSEALLKLQKKCSEELKDKRDLSLTVLDNPSADLEKTERLEAPKASHWYPRF